MELLLMMAVTALTSVFAYVLINRVHPLNARLLLHAVGAFLDWIGLFALFFGANLAFGLLSILAIRGLTPRFVSLYELENFLLPILSAIQAFVFQHWWKRA